MKRLRFACCALALLGLGVLAWPGGARANGVPQLVKLTYLNGVSNWGPKDGEGVLEFSFAEAYARVDVKNLPPRAGYSYEGWLTGGEGEPLLVGPITTSEAGVGVLETKLKDLNRYDYNTFVVAARGPAAPQGAMPAEKSIAGRFTVIKDEPGSSAGADTRPSTLPDTGEHATSTRERIGRTVTVVAIAGGVAIAGLGFLRRVRRHD